MIIKCGCVTVGNGFLLVRPLFHRLSNEGVCILVASLQRTTLTHTQKRHKRYPTFRLYCADNKMIALLTSVASALGVSRILWQRLGLCREIVRLGLMVARRTCR
jgi:hypothetical protein